MKFKLILTGIGLSSLVMAHGPKAEQASEAVEAAAKLFVKNNSAEISKNFYSVAAELTGHERFTVSIATVGNAQKFSYDCSENEMVEPVEWVCKVVTE